MADGAKGAFAMSGGRHHHAVRWRAAWSALSGAGRLALALIVIAGLVLVVSAAGLATTLLAPSAGRASSAAMDEKQLAERFAAGFERSLAQVNGRSMFFDPVAPRHEPVRTASDDSDKPPPAPTRYGGPALIGFANGAAWFADGKKLGEGEGGDSRFKVKKVVAPWSAVVEWEGVEFTVGLFDRDRLVLPRASVEGAGEAGAANGATSGVTSGSTSGATESAGSDIKKSEAKEPVVVPAAAIAKPETTPATAPATTPESSPGASPKKR